MGLSNSSSIVAIRGRGVSRAKGRQHKGDSSVAVGFLRGSADGAGQRFPRSNLVLSTTDHEECEDEYIVALPFRKRSIRKITFGIV